MTETTTTNPWRLTGQLRFIRRTRGDKTTGLVSILQQEYIHEQTHELVWFDVPMVQEGD